MTGRDVLLGERIARHGLIGRSCDSVAAAAARTTAVQAQDAPASRLGLRVRAGGCTEADVLEAISIDRTVARTWLMRATIHLVDTADLRWLVRLIGPSVIRRFRTRWRQLGLTDAVLDHSVETLPEVLAAGPLTRREIKAGLAERGVALDSPDPQAYTHALVFASAIGLVCRGPVRGRDATFTLLDDWVGAAPQGPTGDDALAELARRYFAAFSPATAADFTTWSGLAAKHAIELIADELGPADVDGRPGYRLGTVDPERGVCLLPAFDNYLLGYREREAILAKDLRGRIYDGGMIYPAVLLDGRAVGRWELARSGDPMLVTVHPFEAFTRATRRAVEAEVADISRFLDRPAELTMTAPG